MPLLLFSRLNLIAMNQFFLLHITALDNNGIIIYIYIICVTNSNVNKNLNKKQMRKNYASVLILTLFSVSVLIGRNTEFLFKRR